MLLVMVGASQEMATEKVFEAIAACINASTLYRDVRGIYNHTIVHGFSSFRSKSQFLHSAYISSLHAFKIVL